MQSKLKMRHFEAVIALAEEMHYGRAAKRVGLTQSGLSRCIQSAEREAKATLFERNRTRMELTDAGRTYVEHARVAVAFGERAMRSAKATRDGADIVLQLGKAPDVDPILVEILYSIRLPLYLCLQFSPAPSLRDKERWTRIAKETGICDRRRFLLPLQTKERDARCGSPALGW